MRRLTKKQRQRALPAAVAVVTIALAAVFHQPLWGWFSGAPLGEASKATSARAGDLRLEARIQPDPPRQTGNTLRLGVRGPDGEPLEDAHVSVGYSMPAMGAMPEMRGEAQVTPGGPGVYLARFDLPMGGTWTLEASVHFERGSGQARYTLTVGSRGLTPVGSSGASAAAGEAHAPGGHDGGLAPEATADEGESGTIVVDEARRQRIGVKTAPAERKPLALSIRALGKVTYDETRLQDVTLRVEGWIDDLRVDETGQKVKKGEVLFTLYSPELYAAQQEYLLALESQREARGTAAPDRVDSLVRASKRRLQLWGLSGWQIARIAERGEPIENLPFLAPASGYVIEKNVVAGAAVEAGEKLFRIAPLDEVWVEADVYEDDLRHVEKGQTATITLPYLPGETYRGTVTHVFPYLEGATRTGRVRVELRNEGLELRPDMYADVAFQEEVGERLVIPTEAVLYTGPRRLVFVDLGEGRLKPTEVELGVQSDEYVEVTSGLSPGDEVVTSGNFLIAAESRLRSAADYWSDDEG